MAHHARAKAHTNIALSKYWGKRDNELILPMNGSLSLTLDAFHTTTEVRFIEERGSDTVLLNEQPLDDSATAKVSRFLDRVRALKGVDWRAEVHSHNQVPTGAGLASSSSAFAALAGAASRALGLELDERALSILARKGSGSASRSIFGGFALWQAGEDDLSSYAYPLQSPLYDDIAMLVVVINAAHKPVTSREGMRRTVDTSPYYSAWVKDAEQRLGEMKHAVTHGDFTRMGELAEMSAMRMHASMLAAEPPFCYWESGSLQVMQIVRELRAQGCQCYFTMDAGPNVKIITRNSELAVLKRALAATVDEQALLTARPGPGLLVENC
ncbi:diphosphomevalonate decarboxylase [Carnimonas nigrificans]|uniref:diphosphomevalonate decarboxylase n=1 Tax=Carnimonas nigrificans TaxID=64323 RepID=UPI00047152BA|nr:diphosphomevalonate decarboxylase [Carnimonas nigrificans]